MPGQQSFHRAQTVLEGKDQREVLLADANASWSQLLELMEQYHHTQGLLLRVNPPKELLTGHGQTGAESALQTLKGMQAMLLMLQVDCLRKRIGLLPPVEGLSIPAIKIEDFSTSFGEKISHIENVLQRYAELAAQAQRDVAVHLLRQMTEPVSPVHQKTSDVPQTEVHQELFDAYLRVNDAWEKLRGMVNDPKQLPTFDPYDQQSFQACLEALKKIETDMPVARSKLPAGAQALPGMGGNPHRIFAAPSPRVQLSLALGEVQLALKGLSLAAEKAVSAGESRAAHMIQTSSASATVSNR